MKSSMNMATRGYTCNSRAELTPGYDCTGSRNMRNVRKHFQQKAGHLKNCHESVEAIHIEGVYLVEIGDDEIQEAASPGDIPVLLR